MVLLINQLRGGDHQTPTKALLIKEKMALINIQIIYEYMRSESTKFMIKRKK